MHLKIVGFILLILSSVSFLLVFVIPFLNLSLTEKASWAGILYIFCEITWWLSFPFLGKEYITWSKQIWDRLTIKGTVFTLNKRESNS